ncbi:MAG: hypothetical protein AAGC65_01655 [Mucilaginibacter sp.]|uniref:hypothetical protein n=1 Tax=Mucilaginibacter sp. TaxID=1882438 RepID=UPI0031A7FC83
MSELSIKIKSDPIFNAIYEAFRTEFPQFVYGSNEDVLAFKEKEVMIGRIFFLKDTGNTVRFAQLFIGRKNDEEKFGHFFENKLKTQLNAKAANIEAKVAILLTTLAIKSYDLDDETLKTYVQQSTEN